MLRGDLFYRLRVVPIALPPLRKRPEDIAILANHFLTHYWARHRQMPDRPPRLSEDCLAFLRSRPWRGNVRELQNVIEHVAVLAEQYANEDTAQKIYPNWRGGYYYSARSKHDSAAPLALVFVSKWSSPKAAAFVCRGRTMRRRSWPVSADK